MRVGGYLHDPFQVQVRFRSSLRDINERHLRLPLGYKKQFTLHLLKLTVYYLRHFGIACLCQRKINRPRIIEGN